MHRASVAGLLSLLAIGLAGCGDDSGTDPNSAVVGPAGGLLRFDQGRLVLRFPPSAVNEGVEIHVARASSFPDTSLIVEGTVYEIRPEGLNLNVPARVTVSYEAENLPTIAQESELALHSAPGEQWLPLPGNLVADQSNSVSADIDELGAVAILWIPPAPIGSPLPASPNGSLLAGLGERR